MTSPNSSRQQGIECEQRKEGTARIELDLIAEDTEESPEVSEGTAGRRVSHLSRKIEIRLVEQFGEGGSCNLRKLNEKSLLAELITEDKRTDRQCRVKERIDRHSFKLMGSYTNPFWHHLAVVDEKAVLDVSNYLYWPLVHKIS